jgi:hypothetical protein
MTIFVKAMPELSPDGSFFRAILAIHENQFEKVKRRKKGAEIRIVFISLFFLVI